MAKFEWSQGASFRQMVLTKLAPGNYDQIVFGPVANREGDENNTFLFERQARRVPSRQDPLEPTPEMGATWVDIATCSVTVLEAYIPIARPLCASPQLGRSVNFQVVLGGPC